MNDVTKQWVRDESDRRAVKAGHRFDVERAAFVVWWIEHYCSLYEGEWAGAPLRLHGAESVDTDFPIDPDEPWSDAVLAREIERAEAYCEEQAAGRPVDWQFECTTRLFGWQRHSKRWDRWVRRFRRASVWAPKKNKKSPTLAAWGLALLIADGEQGQKVFFGARDGRQARAVVGEHVTAMWEQSRQLRAQCELNRSLLRITYPQTRSFMEPLSSGSLRTKEAKEGLNGSLLIDEAHVVDQDFMNRVERMGISRMEPLHIEISTAGDNPESYGRRQYEYGREVADGKHDDLEFLFVAYEAPQDLSDAKLAEDPLRYGRMANPAWGHTIDPEEFEVDYQRSSRSLQALSRFKQYRLNVWQRSAHPWIRSDDWRGCRRDFTEKDLEGRRCAAGFDFSQVEDMTALSLVFPEDTEAWGRDEPNDDGLTDSPVKLLTWHWLPEAMIERHKNKVDFRKWEQWIRIIPGPTIQAAVVEADIGEILKRFDVQMFEYDERFAFRTVEILISDHGLCPDRAAKFTQSWRSYTGPSALFERLILAHKLEHDGNPVTAWQMGHVCCGRRLDKSMMPLRPGEDKDPRKIDGVMATIMGLDALTRMPPVRRSFYEDHAFEYCGPS